MREGRRASWGRRGRGGNSAAARPAGGWGARIVGAPSCDRAPSLVSAPRPSWSPCGPLCLTGHWARGHPPCPRLPQPKRASALMRGHRVNDVIQLPRS